MEQAPFKRIRIAYLSVNDPLDKRSWSGTTYYIGNTLKRNVGDVDFLGPIAVSPFMNKVLRAIAKTYRILFKKEYDTKYSLLLSRYFARKLEQKLKGKQYDCIVSPASSTELSYLKTNLPVIYISDTTFKLISNYYGEFKDIPAISRWEGNVNERRAIRKSNVAIYSSAWAANSAISDYGKKKEEVYVMPLGANMDFVPAKDVIFEKEKTETLTILFLAVYWERKGGAIAFDTLKKLEEKGVKVKLIVCGCIPPPEFNHPSMEVIPFLNKNKPEDHELFIKLLSSVHFLILPTRADCSLLVACESSAYGVPAITTDTGGVSEIVKNGVNGYCLPHDAGGEEYAETIKNIFENKDEYYKLVRSSRERFENFLNWDSWAKGFQAIYTNHFSS